MSTFAPRRKATPTPNPEIPDAQVAVDFDGAAMLREAGPEYARLADKFAELCDREEQILAELTPLANMARASYDEAGAMLRARAAATPPAMSPAPRPGAAALLDGAVALPAPTPLAASPRSADAERVDQLTSELADVREAIGLLRPQLERAHLTASLALCRQIEPHYREIARIYIAALVGLGRAIEAHHRFTHSIRSVAWSALRPIGLVPNLGRPTELGSNIHRILADAVRTGHIDPMSIPTEWRIVR